MRIISGKFKGKKINLPMDKTTRPLRDLVKESIFNLMEHSNKFKLKIKGSNILDLFSGSGSFGIECISRGAKRVFFIENYLDALKILKKNVSNLNISEKYQIFEEDCFKIFSFKKIINKKLDIIFIDPPYKEKKINYLIDKIKDEKILNKDGLIIIHRHKKDEIILSKKLNILDNRKYGISKIIIGN